MDSPERGALMLVRFIALALIGWAVTEVALYWVICQHHQQPVQIGRVIVKSLPMIVGVIALIKSRALAEWVADKLDL